jgi:phosphoglycolate phosphatase
LTAVSASADLLVLWDVDYTLVNARGFGSELYRTVFAEMFGRPLPVLGSMAGRTDRAIIRETLELAGVPDPAAHVETFIALLAKQALAADPVASADPAASAASADPGDPAAAGRCFALAGAAAALAALASSPGVLQSVLTGNIRPLAEVKLRAAGLTDHLDLEIGAFGDSHEVRAELVHLARRRASGARGRDFAGRATVLIGDTPLDIAAATVTGARSVAVATGSFRAADLTAANVVLDDLTDTKRLVSAVLGS